ncbi:hypothetical protein GCM10010435_13880 [Winogradskya consettensis]|uniref:DUF6036 domain-containing protein n=1 Tax=Winogradskya consettensis TaxID=113560 RepID=A0A919SC35_9ACTN|nr:hypothetical protein Aco04nite_13150 [Actinoplanes consettensis]
MTNGGLLGRAELEHAFTVLGERLARRGVVADLFVVGGAAMALAYDANRVTRDVDATCVPHGVVLEEARNVAEEPDLPPWWLNEQASAYVSTQKDVGSREVFDHQGIRVMAASPEHVFAMKAFAARSRDEKDLRTLAAIVGIGTLDAALSCVDASSPRSPCRQGHTPCSRNCSSPARDLSRQSARGLGTGTSEKAATVLLA